MDWLWELYKDYIKKYLRNKKNYNPTEEELQNTFIQVLGESSVTILVQEPWQNAVRFKGLKKGSINEMMPLINNPNGYLVQHFGGGKFKLNFHQGMNFIATINYKPEGTPLWPSMPSIYF